MEVSESDEATGSTDSRPGPRRAPAPEQRQRDAERSRRVLLEAALEEFSAKGFAGARVADIAARAGVNKQLINYYFEGKEGLYRELQRRWLDREADFADPTAPLDDLASAYLHDALADPRLVRLLLWRGLAEAEQAPDESPTEDLESMRMRQAAGELAADLDPAAVRLALYGMVLAPIALPHLARQLLGADLDSPEFENRYRHALQGIIHRLAAPPAG